LNADKWAAAIPVGLCGASELTTEPGTA